jgi:flavin-dependent dehydrogenase
LRERDVVIVGGGPAGAATALALVQRDARLAERVLLLDRARFPRDKPCAGALGARGDALLRDLGLDVNVPSVQVDGISFRGTERAASASPGRIGRVVRRIEFDHALVRAVTERGVEVRDGVRVQSVSQDGDRGALLETDAGALRARVVVGCDGVGSVVRKALRTAPARMRAQVVEVDTEPAAVDGDRRHLHFDASDRRLAGYAWDFPTLVDGRALVCRGVYRLTIEGDRAVDERELGQILTDRLRAQGLDPTRFKNKRYAERGYEPTACLARGSLMLVGEAAGIDPVTGEGIAQALEYGVLAGRFLAERVRASGALRRIACWQDEVARSRLARDLRMRRLFARLFYGPSRDRVERWFTESSDAVYVGCQHFAGESYDWTKLARVLARGAARLAGPMLSVGLERST